MLKSEEIVNVEGYIWRISEHVYSRYVSQTKKHQGISMDGFEIPVEYDFVDENDRLRERQFITEDGKVNIMIVKGKYNDLFDKIPSLNKQIEKEFVNIAFDYETQIAKSYPPQMQDLVIHDQVVSFIGVVVAIMTMDILYQKGIFKPLTNQEKLSANLLMFSDILPIKN